MHSLNLKVFTDFNSGTTRSWPGRRGPDLDTGTRRLWLSCRDHAKQARIAACSQRNGGSGAAGGGGGGSGGVESQAPSRSSFLSRSQTYALLKQQMEVAAKSEDYKEAARLRDSLRLFEEEEPILRLRRLLKEAIVDERFEVYKFKQGGGYGTFARHLQTKHPLKVGLSRDQTQISGWP